MRGATHTQHTAPKKTWVLFFLLAPTHLTSARSTRTPKFLTSLLQKTPAPLLPHYYRKNLSSPSSSLALQLGSSFVTLLKSVSTTRGPRGKRSRLTPRAKKLGVPGAAELVVHPAPSSARRSGEPPPHWIPGTCRISGGPHQRSPGRHPWGDHLASPHQGLLPHPSPLNSVAPSMARRAP